MEQKPIFLKKIYADESPYPSVSISFPNRNDGLAMLDNIGGNHSEMSAISLYIYNHLSLAEHKEIAMDFRSIAIVEMHHLHIFGDLAAQCGEDPRLWTRRGNRNVYWSPSYNQYPSALDMLLRNAIDSEEAAIQKYESQITYASDPSVAENLKRIILDERIHVEIFKDLHKRFIN